MTFIKFQTAFTMRSRPTRSFFRFTLQTRKPLEKMNGSRIYNSSSTSTSTRTVATGEKNKKTLSIAPNAWQSENDILKIE